MAHLLHIDSSASPASTSAELAATFATAFLDERPEVTVTHRDLGADPVPHISEDAIMSDHLPAEVHTPAQAEAAAVRDRLATELEAADALLISVPMYNWTVPSSLKAWIDQVLIAGRTLTFGPVSGPLAGKPVVVMVSIGGAYGPGSPQEKANHVEPYLRTVFADMLGMDVTVITRQLTLAGIVPGMEHLIDAAEKSRDEATALAEELGRKVAANL